MTEYNDLYQFKNYGIDLEKQKKKFEDPRNYKFGAVSGKKILKPDSDWSKSMPVFEIQKTLKMDEMNCLNQAATKAHEILMETLFGILIDISQRYPSTLSETTPQGNDMFSVGSAWNNYAFVEEKDWPSDKNMSWSEYYTPIPERILAIGRKVLKQFIKI
jgi:adenylosuccinate synthase